MKPVHTRNPKSGQKIDEPVPPDRSPPEALIKVTGRVYVRARFLALMEPLTDALAAAEIDFDFDVEVMTLAPVQADLPLAPIAQNLH